MANIMNEKTKYLIGRWGKRIAMVEKAQGHALSYEKRAVLANSLENTASRIKAMEATNPNSIGQYKRYALDIITASVPNLIAFDVMAVQAMDNRIGMINYMDYNYSKTKGQTKAGQTFASSINMGPSDPFYSSDLVDHEDIGALQASKQYSVKLPWTPVLVGTVTIESEDGTFMASADTTGAITGVGIDTTGENTVTADGTIKFKTAASVQTGKNVYVSYRFNNEDVRSDGPEAAGFTNVPEVELKINSLPVEATARTMRSFWAFDAAYELQKEYGQDIETLLATQVTGELAHEIDNELTLDLLHFANADTPLTWSKSLTPGISLVDHYDSFNSVLVEGANRIFKATRKVKANFIVCGLGVASVIEVMRNFSASGITAVGPHFLGTLGTYKVFVNPDYPDNEFVLGYKGSTMFDAGAFYCPYMPVSSTDLIMDANFRGQRGWATMYGKKLLNSKMYIRGRITD